jgi:hypothetical protein
MSTDRKPYERPKVERVRLVVEETVLAFCKGPGGSHGPQVGACNNSGGPGNCLVRGT